jgi:hypothetical protein
MHRYAALPVWYSGTLCVLFSRSSFRSHSSPANPPKRNTFAHYKRLISGFGNRIANLMAILDSETPNLSGALHSQWSNPSDILSVLLIVGGDIVQKAIAQLSGFFIQPFSRSPKIYIVPVAFSFGWVAYSFATLLSVVGDMRLMPSSPDCPSIVINGNNGFVRSNASWVLGRILRDQEKAHEIDPNDVSLRVDIFSARDNPCPDTDRVWWSGVVVILLQLLIAAIPFMLYFNWAILMVTICGTGFALFSGALPQWSKEKWSGRSIKESRATNRTKTVCLTRGNGGHHVMIIIGEEIGWDLEALASATPVPQKSTLWLVIMLAVFWTALLITVAGLKYDTWYLLAIGGIGMVQNVFAAGSARTPGALNVHVEPWGKRSTIMGRRSPRNDELRNKAWEKQYPSDFTSRVEEPWGVMGALREVEKELPRVGASLFSVFFPTGAAAFKHKYDQEFWSYMDEAQHRTDPIVQEVVERDLP